MTRTASIETAANLAAPLRESGAVVTPLSPLVDRTFGGPEAKEFERKAWLAEHTSQSDKNPKLDALRMDALQAATAYKLSPCDKTMKQNLVDALTAYTRAYVAKLDCKRQFWGAKICTDKSLQEAADSVGTPLDQRVKEALFEAFDEKGITKADFPADVREDVPMFAGPGLWSDESSVCRIRQAQRDRR
ncbi:MULTISPECIES: hypothetical protein [unclassified Bradyrhizobium]|uniref:hypothetical protein n=1 Tax=unclassified Bradyrhizobium TaxID=2631580 RepID=UPI0028E1DC62|nr:MULTISPECIES: hypothetical protein [unclassified Bradyrhizobium]